MVGVVKVTNVEAENLVGLMHPYIVTSRENNLSGNELNSDN